MDKQTMKKMATKCAKEPALSRAKVFLLVAVDREAVGMGGSGALVWERETGNWTMRFLRMISRSATAKEGVDIVGLEDLYDDDPDGDQFAEEETEEAADCTIMHDGSGFEVRFHAHVNRTGDGLRIKEDFVSMEQGDSQRELPIVYWNSGRYPIKTDGTKIPPNGHHISLPGDPARLARKELKREQDKYLKALVRRSPENLPPDLFRAVKLQIMEWKPDWTEEQAHKAAEMFLAQDGNV